MKLRLSIGVIFSFFFFWMFVFPVGTNKPLEPKQRAPSSIDGGSCNKLIKLFLPSKASRIFAVFNNLKNVTKDYPFNIKKFNSLKEEYKSMIELHGASSVEMDRTVEGVLAFAEALNHKNHIELGPSLEQMSKRKRRLVTQLTSKITNNKSFSLEDLESSVAELYSTILGPMFKVSDILPSERGKKRILFRVLAEDITVNGFLPTIKKYKIIKDPNWVTRVSKFFDTKKGKSLSTSLFNLPVIWGMPPMYLPGLKRIKVPHELVKESMEKGLNDEMVKKLVAGINKNLTDTGSLKLNTQAKYRVFRRYYLYGVSAFTVYLMYSEFRLAEQYREETRIYEDALDDISERIDDINVLEERGFNIFNDDTSSNESDDIDRLNIDQSNPSQSFCRAIRDCLQSEKEALGSKPEKGSESYNACKEFMDPDNKCQEL